MTDVEASPSSSLSIRATVVQFLRHVADVASLIDLTHMGCRSICNNLGIHEQIKELADDYSGLDQARFESAANAASLAASEISKDFPLLHGHALLGLWSALEAAVDDLCLAQAVRNPSVFTSETFSKVKVVTSTLLVMSREEQARFLLDEAKRQRGAVHRVGVDQFEGCLTDVGLSGSTDPSLQSVLRYAKGMRNVLAHRGGRIDDKFNATCADLGLQVGHSLAISYDQFLGFIDAMVLYIEEVYDRALIYNGFPARGVNLPPRVSTFSDLVRPFELMGAGSGSDA